MALIQDNSSGATLIPANASQGSTKSTDYGTWRGIGSDWFNAEKVAAEDFAREQQLIQQEMQFNSNEAQKQRDFEERLSNTSYQRAVADMQAAGINPLLAYANGGASTPSASSASIGGHSASRGGSGSNMSQLVGGLLNFAGKFVGKSNKPAGVILQVVGKGIQGNSNNRR